MAKASISIAKGKGSIAHNNREYSTPNVDKNLTPNNITYKAEPLDVAYEKCFGKAVEDYNNKQKRSDRKIDGVRGYMEQVRTSKNGEKLFYENVVQVGNMQDSHIGTEQGDKCQKVLNAYMQDFQERNPNLYVFNAVLHADEQTPHLHIDYIPLADGYQKGMSLRNSLDRALSQQGIEGKANKYQNRTIAWQNGEKDHIEGIMREYGLERTADKGLNREHMTVEQYKAVAEQVHNEVRHIPKQIETAPMLLNSQRVSVDKDDLAKLVKRAKLSLIHEKYTKDMIAQHKNNLSKSSNMLAKIERNLDLTEKRLQGLSMHEEALNKEKKELLGEVDVIKKDLQEKTNHQINLNQDYNNLEEKYNKVLAENKALKADIGSIENKSNEKIEEITKSLTDRITSLEKQLAKSEESLDGMCESLKNVVQAYGMLKYDNESGYKVALNDKQKRLFDGIENYSKYWLKAEGKNDLVKDIEKSVGISNGIKLKMEDLTPIKKRSSDLSL